MASDLITMGPQEGPQSQFLYSEADICIYGGAAGGGKTYGLLLEFLRHFQEPEMGSVIFRRTYPQIRNEGGLWDESLGLFPLFDGSYLETRMEWIFPSGYKLKFAHMQHEKDRFAWQGAQIPLIGFDELTHFTEKQFWYLVSRNRSAAGMPCYIRATCNPDPDSFVAKLIEWWIDEDGWAIPERSGLLRYFIRLDDRLVWADSAEELIEEYGSDDGDEILPMSFTFIPSKVFDNKILLAKDPKYLAALNALPYVERMRLKDGNWKVRPSAGLYFKKQDFEIVETPPVMRRVVRFWDRAATEKTDANDPDWTAGLKLGHGVDGFFYVIDIRRFQEGPHKVETSIKNTASLDGLGVKVGLEQEPGASGKAEIAYLIKALAGFSVEAYPAQKDKVTRAGPVSSQTGQGNIRLVRGEWNEDFLNELERFPEGANDDQVDGFSGAFYMMTSEAVGDWTSNMSQSGETMAGSLGEKDEW